VLSPRELESRYEIYLEQYSKTVNVEAKLTQKISKTTILPAALRYQRELAETAAAAQAVGAEAEKSVLLKVSGLITQLVGAIDNLDRITARETHGGSLDHAKYFCYDVLPAMLKVRGVADELEGIVADDLWPLPTYQEMLFIK
jgi:glutamine synthetase